jgi:hypothetical protein
MSSVVASYVGDAAINELDSRIHKADCAGMQTRVMRCVVESSYSFGGCYRGKY